MNNSKNKKKIGVSYTKAGRRIHVYREDFKDLDEYVDKAESIILYGQNPRTLKSTRRIKDFDIKAAARKGRKAKR